MSFSIDKENKELSKLININEDAAEFYEAAQDKAESDQMKTTFSSLEELHKDVTMRLGQIVQNNGGNAHSKETLMGEVRQFFGNLHAKISNDVDETLVTHLEEAEDRCLHSIQDAMVNDDISLSTRSMLQKELTALQKSHDYMKALKDQMKQAA